MNIHDLPIPNFGELEDEAALKLILEVRLRRRVALKPAAVKAKSTSERAVPKVRAKKVFNSPLGALTKEQMLELLAELKKGN